MVDRSELFGAQVSRAPQSLLVLVNTHGLRYYCDVPMTELKGKTHLTPPDSFTINYVV